MAATTTLDTIEINNRTHLISGIQGQNLKVIPYTSKDQAEADLLTQSRQAQQAGNHIAGITKTPIVLRLASLNGRTIAVLATLETSQGNYLITGMEGQEMEAELFSGRNDRDIDLAERLTDMTRQGLTITN